MSAAAEDAGHAYGDGIRRQLEHEDSLTINRLSWLVASQSFLFTAYAIVLNGLPLARDPFVASRQGELLRIVPELGLATSGLIYLGVLAGVRVTLRLRHALEQRQPRTDTARPPLPGSAATHAFGLAAPLLLPPIFFAAWAVLLPGW